MIEKSLTEHRSTGDKSLPVDLKPSDLQGQYELLSSMSNDHDGEYPGNEPEHPTRKLSNGKIECYRTYQSKITESGTTKKKRHPPTSFRNRFVYFIVKNDLQYVDVLLRFHYDGVRYSETEGEKQEVTTHSVEVKNPLKRSASTLLEHDAMGALQGMRKVNDDIETAYETDGHAAMKTKVTVSITLL